MPINKNAALRYKVLDHCFGRRGKGCTIEQLMEACNEALADSGGKPISKRQVYEDIKFMESERGYGIGLERNPDGRHMLYRYETKGYSIYDRSLDQAEAEQLRQAVQLLSRFKGLPRFTWLEELSTRLMGSLGLREGAGEALSFQENQYLEGIEHLTPLLDAILARRAVAIAYKGFKQAQVQHLLFHPHLLKQYNNRWFALGFQEDRQGLTNLALDRITSVEVKPTISYRPPMDDLGEHFEDVVGVSVPPDAPVELVHLRVEADTWPYIHTKPLHHSQKKTAEINGQVMITIKVKPNHELFAMLLQYGPGVELMGPENVRQIMAERVRQMATSYGVSGQARHEGPPKAKNPTARNKNKKATRAAATTPRTTTNRKRP